MLRFRIGVLQGVGHQLVDDKSQLDRQVQLHSQRGAFDDQLHPVSRQRAREPRRQVGEVVIHFHQLVAPAPIKFGMKVGDGVDAGYRRLEVLAHFGRRVAPLKGQEARHNGEIVLHTVIEFIE